MTLGQSHAEFVTLISAGILTDDQIAEQIRTYSPGPAERAEIINALFKIKGGGPITGPIRTALRSLHGDHPIPRLRAALHRYSPTCRKRGSSIAFRAVTYSEDLLTQRVRQLLITVRSTTSVYLFPIPEPGRYDPRTLPPAFLWIRDSLNPHERLLATVHELTHACLHPPGCGDYDEAAYCNEEPCSHRGDGHGLCRLRHHGLSTRDGEARRATGVLPIG